MDMKMRRLLLVVICFCYSSTICGFPSEQDGPKPVCEPRKTFVAWKSVRNYLVHHYGQFTIPGTWIGKPLEVLRCRNFLDPCTENGFYCGTDREETREILMLITDGDKEVANLTIEYVQDETCRCSTTQPIVDDVETPPYIFNSSVQMISME